MQQFERIGRFVAVRRGSRSVGGGLEWVGGASMAAVDVTLALESHLTVRNFFHNTNYTLLLTKGEHR